MESKTSTYEEKTVRYTYQPTEGKTVNTTVTVRHFESKGTYEITMKDDISYWGHRSHEQDTKTEVEFKTSTYQATQLKRILASFGL